MVGERWVISKLGTAVEVLLTNAEVGKGGQHQN